MQDSYHQAKCMLRHQCHAATTTTGIIPVRPGTVPVHASRGRQCQRGAREQAHLNVHSCPFSTRARMHVPHPMSQMNDINRLMEEAGRSYQAGDLLGAADLFRQALHVDASPFAEAARQFVAGFPVQDLSQFWQAPVELYPAGGEVQDIFAFIYDRSVWGGGSGAGSNLQVTVPYIGYLRYLMEHHDVRTIVDLGCGDWRFARHLDFTGREYIGYDVVPSVVEANRVAYGAPNIRFEHADAAQVDSLPEADLIVCKDVLQHLSNRNVLRVLEKCARARLALFTNDYHPLNADCSDGDTRPLDVSRAPFSLAAGPVLQFGRKVSFLLEQ